MPFVNPAEAVLGAFCKQYWGRGESARREIFHTKTAIVPFLEDRPVKALRHQGSEVAISTGSVSTTMLANTVTYTVLSLKDLKIFFPFDSEMLVRDEYKEMLVHIQNLQKNPAFGGVVVTGQSGIGRTFFNYYLLVHRIIEGLPTVFHLRRNETYLLLGRDEIRICKEIKDIGALLREEKLSQDAWILVDSKIGAERPPSELVDQPLFVIQNTPPVRENWRDWSQKRNAPLAVMKLWSWEETHVGGTALNDFHLDSERLRYVYTKFGASTRQCYRLAASGYDERKWEYEISSGLSYKNLRDVARGFESISSSPWDHPSSSIFDIIPDVNRQPLISVATYHAAIRVVEAMPELDYEREEELSPKLLDLHLSAPQSLIPAGWLWERYVVDRLVCVRAQKDILLKALAPVQVGDRPLNSRHAQDISIPIAFRNTVRYSDRTTLTTGLTTMTASTSFFVPTEPGLVPFSISGGGQVTLFQSTVLDCQPVNASALQLVGDAVMEALIVLEKDASELKAASYHGKSKPESRSRSGKKALKAKMEAEAKAREVNSIGDPLSVGQLRSTIATLSAASQVMVNRTPEAASLGIENKWRVVFVVMEPHGPDWTQEQPIDVQDESMGHWGSDIIQFVTVMTKGPSGPRNGQWLRPPGLRDGEFSTTFKG